MDRISKIYEEGVRQVARIKYAICLAFVVASLPIESTAQHHIVGSSQDAEIELLETYYHSMDRLRADEIEAAAAGFARLDEEDLGSLSQHVLYNGAFVFARDSQPDRAFRWLDQLIEIHRFDDPDRLQADPDFSSLRDDPRWDRLIAQAESNLETRDQWLPDRVTERLRLAKRQIQQNAGDVWGMTFWDDHILILVDTEKAYTPLPLEGAAKTRDGLYQITLAPNEVSFTNTVQDFRGQRFVTVTLSDLGPYGDMLIHELFHLAQEKTLSLPGLPVPYLENTEARTLLRAEYAALRSGLQALRDDQRDAAAIGLADAVRFRALRHERFARGRRDTVEMETLEGLANYTGLKLSTFPDKALVAIQWLNSWERSDSYTRTFPYATGPAFGLLMDALAPDWKPPHDTLHDFSELYAQHFGPVDMTIIDTARARVGFAEIQAAEQVRLDTFTAKSDALKRIFYEQPVIIAEIENRGYAVSYNMNGTTTLSEDRIVYDFIKATDTIGDQFGDFESAPPEDLTLFGILEEAVEGGARFIFPAPVTRVGHQLIHPHYTITLNEGWDLVQSADPRVQTIERVDAQTHKPLTRRAYFGLGGEPSKTKNGLTLTFVDANATAGFAGLEVGDVLLSVDEVSTSSMADLIAVAQTKRAGMTTRFTIQRGEDRRTVQTVVRGKPMEESEGLIVSYDSVEIEGGRSRLITYRQDTTDALPALFYLPGFSCASIDFGGTGDNTIRRFVEDVAREGVVVVRQEKPGIGDSISDTTCDAITFDEEVEAFSQGVAWMKRQPFIDPEKIFFFGHSLGGVTAPALLEAHAPLGIAAYGAPSRRWFEYKLDVFNEQPEVLGRDLKSASERAAYGIPYFRDVMTTQMSWSEIEAAHPKAISNQISMTTGETILGRHFSFLRTLNDFDVETAWRNYSGNVLALHGSYDVHVISDKDARGLVSKINEEGQGLATLRIIPGAEHGLSRPEGTKEQYILDLRFGKWTASKALASYDPRIANETVRWIKELTETSE